MGLLWGCVGILCGSVESLRKFALMLSSLAPARARAVSVGAKIDSGFVSIIDGSLSAFATFPARTTLFPVPFPTLAYGSGTGNSTFLGSGMLHFGMVGYEFLSLNPLRVDCK